MHTDNTDQRSFIEIDVSLIDRSDISDALLLTVKRPAFCIGSIVYPVANARSSPRLRAEFDSVPRGMDGAITRA